MEIPHEILIIGLVLLPQKPAGVLLWTSVRAGASLFKKGRKPYAKVFKRTTFTPEKYLLSAI